jgi:hypothetical protein
MVMQGKWGACEGKECMLLYKFKGNYMPYISNRGWRFLHGKIKDSSEESGGLVRAKNACCYTSLKETTCPIFQTGGWRFLHGKIKDSSGAGLPLIPQGVPLSQST